MRRLLLVLLSAAVFAGAAALTHSAATEAGTLMIAPAMCDVDDYVSDGDDVSRAYGRLTNYGTTSASLQCPIPTSLDTGGPLADTSELSWVEINYDDWSTTGWVSAWIGSFDPAVYYFYSLCPTKTTNVSPSYAANVGLGSFLWGPSNPCMLSGSYAVASITLPAAGTSGSSKLDSVVAWNL